MKKRPCNSTSRGSPIAHRDKEMTPSMTRTELKFNLLFLYFISIGVILSLQINHAISFYRPKDRREDLGTRTCLPCR
ncbi:hypothetical protein PHYBLDRAFT_140638 [Phycomyces blakesleeanus NRRL 1555(-)]|uniref:Uncharacterized protein n=1 Tax=Phycomyces blakesleeanus (strain ATCC 8743b / DSM 1359 / FGSC 10004 / NBRC 33097 / NRRL 1555) TaxID=763407 RepID=A0A167PUR2_PHYB8|nr:hypothetical protein PHYBLDRAFT_140638 [Phycomyces blakesleeanus NRRL 1555(-)]OAD78568.1 hypothetical protein PHYBLDRAFT_140638 [Phycomyces blakesleeanus NRRL 1555(-)]|eukprot:XP_018296608.1 hypothetical protein PHYBLDRAFT_140638 [Phycomyces blakesleeanus NRRL 1555(-)]